MNEQDYEFLIELYETKNITKMAQKNFFAQPTLTKRIQKLEQELGCQLMLRGKKGIIFTADGEQVVSYCRQMLQTYQQLQNTLNLNKGIVGGTLNVGASLNYCRYRLPKALTDYVERYPKVNVSIATGHSRYLYNMLLEDKISVAIVRGNYSWQEGCRLLSSEPVCLIKSLKQTTDEIGPLNYIGRRTDISEERQIEAWLRENHIAIQAPKLLVDDINSCKELVQAGLGWSILPRICLDGFVGSIQPLFMKDGTPLTRNTYALYHESKYQLQQVKLFLDILIEIEQKNI